MTRHTLFALALVQVGCMETSLSKLATDAASMDTGERMDIGEEPEEEEHEDEEEREGENNIEEPEEDEYEEPPPEDDCDETSDLIYVIDRTEASMYLFDPETLSFDFLGELDCGIWAGTPGSMSVTRDGTAYVRYSDNTVYAVDLETMDCSETTYESGSFGAFGMGYATNSGATWRDKLYIANANRLAVVDTADWSVSHMGNLPSQSELTGNAEGELWAMLPLETPAKLVRLNKNTASVQETLILSGTPSPYDIDAFAFATWGGDFWVFIRTYGMGQTTDVYRVTGSGSTSRVAVNTGMDIVGAGVSTCAPTD
jgi:hypothetical protein